MRKSAETPHFFIADYRKPHKTTKKARASVLPTLHCIVYHFVKIKSSNIFLFRYNYHYRSAVEKLAAAIVVTDHLMLRRERDETVDSITSNA